MKLKMVIVLSALFIAKTLFADTCPSVKSFDPINPPAGWTILLSPVIDGENYHFSSAIHSLSGVYYNGQVICKYSSCPNSFCPAFAIISNKTYELPNTKAYPWNERSVLAFTLTCTPPDHDPLHCVFQ